MDSDRRAGSIGDVGSRISPLGLFALGVAYLALSIAVWQLADPETVSAPWWPAAGLTLGVMCRTRVSQWPAIALTVFAADFLADQTESASLLTSLGWATANAIEPLLGAAALRWAFHGRLPDFETIRNFGKFVLVVAVAGAPIASLIGGATSALSYDLDLLVSWRDWYIGDVLGILVVAPIVLYYRQFRETFDIRLAAMLAATAIVSFAIFWTAADELPLRLYLITPVLVATAVIFGAPGAASAGLIVATIANIGSARGYGPYAQVNFGNEELLQLQLFTFVELTTAYVMVGLRAQLLTATSQANFLRQQRERDPLTNVGSRYLLDKTIEEVTTPGADGTGEPAAVLVIDLDDFKPINDVFGHAAGDDVLCVVARRIEGVVRGLDTVARLGGDEFAVVCPGIDDAGAQQLAERLERKLREPMVIGNTRMDVGASIGVNWVPEPTGDPASFLREADMRMYAVKTRHRQPSPSAYG